VVVDCLDNLSSVNYNVRTFELQQTSVFEKWRDGLEDNKVRAIIAARLDRLGFGLLGDVTPVGDGVRELRIQYGAGFRIYFKQSGKTIIILLCGGDKSTQDKDIKKARELAQELEL
jgi:putative addiction module killer protein